MYQPAESLLVIHEPDANGGAGRSPATFAGIFADMDAHDPIRLERLVDLAADATRRASPGPLKRYAKAAGVSVSRASRHLNGDDPYSPTARMYALVDALARSDYGSAIPLISEQINLIMAALQDRPPDELRRMRTEWVRNRIDRENALRHAELETAYAFGIVAEKRAEERKARMGVLEADFMISSIDTALDDAERRGRP